MRREVKLQIVPCAAAREALIREVHDSHIWHKTCDVHDVKDSNAVTRLVSYRWCPGVEAEE